MDNNVTIAHLKNLVIDKPAPITTKLTQLVLTNICILFSKAFWIVCFCILVSISFDNVKSRSRSTIRLSRKVWHLCTPMIESTAGHPSSCRSQQCVHFQIIGCICHPSTQWSWKWLLQFCHINRWIEKVDLKLNNFKIVIHSNEHFWHSIHPKISSRSWRRSAYHLWVVIFRRSFILN